MTPHPFDVPFLCTSNSARSIPAVGDAYRMLKRRIDRFIALPLDKLDPASLKQELSAIGKIDNSTGA